MYTINVVHKDFSQLKKQIELKGKCCIGEKLPVFNMSPIPIIVEIVWITDEHILYGIADLMVIVK